jgi:hypothetical protein
VPNTDDILIRSHREAMDNDYVRIRPPREAAAIVNLSQSRLDRFRCEGGGPTYCKLGPGVHARVGYRLADLEAWLEACSRTSTSAPLGSGK